MKKQRLLPVYCLFGKKKTATFSLFSACLKNQHSASKTRHSDFFMSSFWLFFVFSSAADTSALRAR